MANRLAGTDGLVKVAGVTVAECRGWNIERQADVVECTVLRDTSKRNKPSLKSWNGSLSCFWDPTDATGQGALTEGAEVVLTVYPEGATIGDKYFTGSAIVTSLTNKGEVGGMVEADFSFVGNGALTEATVA